MKKVRGNIVTNTTSDTVETRRAFQRGDLVKITVPGKTSYRKATVVKGEVDSSHNIYVCYLGYNAQSLYPTKVHVSQVKLDLGNNSASSENQRLRDALLWIQGNCGYASPWWIKIQNALEGKKDEDE